MSIDAALAGARQLWGTGLEPTPDNLRAAAVGLASQWYRNTEAVEQHAHAAGPWGDRDMVRHNARATALCLAALTQMVGTPEQALGVFDELIDNLAAMLPTKKASVTLLDEKGGAPDLAVPWIKTNGMGYWLAFLAAGPLYPVRWWGAPAFERIVDQYCKLDPGPPDPESFRIRLLTAPWDLSDEQAQFVCDHRYDVG